MLKLTGFEAQVEVRGTVCAARFTGATLTLVGLNMAQAKDALDMLETGQVTRRESSVAVVADEEAAEVAAPQAPPPPKKASKKKASKKKRTSVEKKRTVIDDAVDAADGLDAPSTGSEAPPPSSATAEPAQEASAPPPVTTADAPEEPAFGSQERPHPAPRVNSPPVVDDPPPASSSSPKAQGEAVPEKLRTMKRFRGVLSYFLDNGFEADVEALTAECDRLREEVPVLSRIANMRERVERTLSVMDTGQFD